MSCCGTGKSGCCASSESQEVQVKVAHSRVLEVEFLYLDRTFCDRCKGTEEVLREAVAEAQKILGPTGVAVSLKMTQVTSEQEALSLGFLSSPTVRIMGRDAELDVKENPCQSCGELSGCDISCRVWTWQGQEYSVPPKAMMLDAILRDAYLHLGGERLLPAAIPRVSDNLRRFFRGLRPHGQ
jgi:hypothetical protein